jgi:glutaminase
VDEPVHPPDAIRPPGGSPLPRGSTTIVADVPSPVDAYLASVHAAHLPDRSGRVYDGIPELARVDADAFGICLATVDGHLYEAGDTRTDFTIQSISKTFTYALALADRGLAAVDAKIDVEPSGEAFYEISLSPQTGLPSNAMINAGAIAACWLIEGDSPHALYERVRGTFSRAADRELAMSDGIFSADLAVAHRHRAIGHLLRGSGVIESDPDPAVELYFRQCALQLDCRDLALMAATLANGGVQPRTGERIFEPEVVERVLSVMATCGMYDAAGEWVVDVGLPAKSGVGGGVLAVLPGQVGIALYSPRLDRHGNSVRGVAACRQISRELELHFLRVASERRSAIRDAWDVGSWPSSRRRTPDEQEVLNEHRASARVYALHGDLLFAGAESVVREVTERAPALDVIVLDISRVAEIARVARTMLAATQAELQARGCRLALVDPDGDLAGEDGIAVFEDIDEATAWAEDRLIERHGGTLATTAPIPLAEHGLAGDLRPDELGALRPLLERRHVAAGERIVAAGAEPAGIFFIVSGQATADLTDEHGVSHRVAVLPAGTSFGKRAVISGEPHATDVCADTDLDLFVLTPQAMNELERRSPRTAIALLRTMFTQQRAAPEPTRPEELPLA